MGLGDRSRVDLLHGYVEAALRPSMKLEDDLLEIVGGTEVWRSD
jgi:hypothetical protein